MGPDSQPDAWGAMDRFQAHFVVVGAGRGRPDSDYVARTRVRCEGPPWGRRVAGVSWDGAGPLAAALNSDSELAGMIAALGPRRARITVEPAAGGVRVRGGWSNHLEFGVSREEYDVFDRIAGHVRSA